jgi:tRNA(fMet)-specific endonuclease VapC
LPILPFDAAAAELYADRRAQLIATPLADADLRIAAIALTHDLTVVTANVRHFARCPGLRVENWLEP